MNATIGKRRAFVLLILTLAVLVAAVLVTDRFHFRLDLTADHTYTLSQASRELHKSVSEQVRITYYVSPMLAARHPAPRAIQDFLEEFAAASHGKISVEVTDPGAGNGERAAAIEALGVQPQRMQIVDRNEQRVALVYSGIVVQYLDKTQVIPFVLGTSTLEYDLVKAIRTEISDRSNVADFLVGDSDKSLGNDYGTLTGTMRKNGWSIQEIHPGDAVPPEASVLIVLGNNGLDDYATYRIDAYLAGGGKVLFAAKGVNVDARQNLTATPLANNPLLSALDDYGVKVDPDLVLDPSSLTVPFQEASPYGGALIRYVRYPHWIITRPENRDAKNPLTARLAGLDLFWASPLELEKRSGVDEQSLVETTPKAWLQTKHFAVGPEDEPYYAEEADNTTGRYLLAVSLSGILPQAYAGRPVPTRSGSEALPPLPSASRPSRIIVVGSSDFATDLMTMTDSQFNASFISDAADWLASGNELVSIRTRGMRDMRLARIQDPDVRNAVIMFIYVLNLGLVPLLVLVFGLLRAGKRRRIARDPVPVAVSQADEGRSS
ncbi:MAG: GldG family protein [Rectinemataceae bacterium]